MKTTNNYTLRLNPEVLAAIRALKVKPSKYIRSLIIADLKAHGIDNLKEGL